MHILWLKTELLHPLDKGGKIRTHGMLSELKRHHRISYLTLDDESGGDDAVTKASEYCDDLIRVPHVTTPKNGARFYAELAANLFSPLPYFVAKYRSRAMRTAISARLARGDVDLLVCDFLIPSINLPDVVPCPTLLFQHNVEAEIWRRHWKVESRPIRKAYLYGQWRKARRYERKTCRKFDRVVAVSASDAGIMTEEYGLEEVPHVETGVDTSYFRPDPGARPEPSRLVFTGSMDWLPNVDAIRHFTESILPRIRREKPDVTLAVVGRDPAPELLSLAEEHPAIHVTGTVDDIRPHMERGAVYVLPLRIGGGTRLKVYEAMAMEKPIVSTPVGVEGLPVRDGEELVIAEDPDRFAGAVLRLLDAPGEARAMGRRAAKRVRRDFGWEGVARDFSEICEAVAHGAPDTPKRERERELA